MRRWSDADPRHTSLCVKRCLAATSETIKADGRLKRTRGRRGRHNGCRLVVIGEDGENNRGAALTYVLYSMLRKVERWYSFMMLGLCYGLWWEREAHRKQRQEWNCVIWGTIWQILTGEMRKSRFGPVFEGKKRGDGRGCEELHAGVSAHGGKWKES